MPFRWPPLKVSRLLEWPRKVPNTCGTSVRLRALYHDAQVWRGQSNSSNKHVIFDRYSVMQRTVNDYERGYSQGWLRAVAEAFKLKLRDEKRTRRMTNNR